MLEFVDQTTKAFESRYTADSRPKAYFRASSGLGLDLRLREASRVFKRIFAEAAEGNKERASSNQRASATMYAVHTEKRKPLSHIVDKDQLLDEFKETGDTLCMVVSGMRKNGQKVGKRWNLQTTVSGKMCRNCLIVEDRMIEESLRIKRQSMK